MREAQTYTTANHLYFIAEYGEYFTKNSTYPLFNYTQKPYYMCSPKHPAPLLYFNTIADEQYFCLQLNTYLILIHQHGGSELLS